MKAGQRMTHEQRAVARNKRLSKRWPLLAAAGQLKVWTGAEMEAEHIRTQAHLDEHLARTQARGKYWEDELAKVVSLEDMAAIREKRKIYPASGEYAADLYHRALVAVIVGDWLRLLGEKDESSDAHAALGHAGGLRRQDDRDPELED